MESTGERPRAGLIVKRALWLLGFMVMFLPFAAGAEWLAGRIGLEGIPASMVLQAALLLLVLLFAFVDGGGFRSLGLPGNWEPKDLLIIPGLVMVHYVGSILFSIGMMLFSPGQVEALQESAAGQMLSGLASLDPTQALLTALALGLAPGIVEELVFRGFLISRLERLYLPGWLCVVISAALFGLVHVPGYNWMASLPKALFLGVFAGWFFLKRRSLPQVMIAHFLINFSAFIFAYAAAVFQQQLAA